MGEDDEALLGHELARFRFYPAGTEERRNAHERVRSICADTLTALWALVPPSDERQRMVDALDDVCMRANAAIARADAGE